MNTAPTNPADARARLLEIIKDKAIVHGRVTLSSGKEADYYVDLRRITLDGEAAPLVGQVMRDLTTDLDYDAVGGLTMGADPVATAMLHAAASAGDRLDAFEGAGYRRVPAVVALDDDAVRPAYLYELVPDAVPPSA